MDKVRHHLLQLAKSLHRRKNIIMALSCLVVFVTTYALILPAFTLEKDKAAEQGGIDVPSVESTENVVDENASGEDAQAVNESGGEADTVKADAEASSDEDKAPSKSKGDEKTSGQTKAIGDPITCEGDGFALTVEDTAKVLPEDTAVVATELLEKPAEGTKAERKEAAEAYKNYYDKALAAVNDEAGSSKSISFVRFYDITLQSEGEVIQPDKPVNVTIAYDMEQRKELEVDKKQDVRIIHFTKDEETNEITAEILDDKNVEVTLEQKKMAETTFEAESFSVYGVVYTVDFEYEVDGEAYTYSIPGGSSIKLSELLTILNVTGSEKGEAEENTKAFMENIDKVEFSDPELVEVKKDGDDWTLTSLAPFTSEETLTVTMKNGDEFVVKVTDDATNDYLYWSNAQGYIFLHYVDENGNDISNKFSGNVRQNIGNNSSVTLTDAAYAKSIDGYTLKAIKYNNTDVTRLRAVTERQGYYYYYFAHFYNGQTEVARSDDLDRSYTDVYFIYKSDSSTPEPGGDSGVTLRLQYRNKYGRDLEEPVVIDLKLGDDIDLTDPDYYKDLDDCTFQYITTGNNHITRVTYMVEDGNNIITYYDGDTVVYSGKVEEDSLPFEEVINYVYDGGSATPGGGGTTPGTGTIPIPEPNLDELEKPVATKTLTPNLTDPNDPDSGDGTYTLTLSVTVPELAAQNKNRANIVIAYDSSNSMNEYTQYIQDPRGEYGTWYVDEGYAEDPNEVWKYDKIQSDGTLWDRKAGQWRPYGNRPRFRAGEYTRHDKAKVSVKNLGKDLLDLNKTFGDDTIQLAFVEYGTTILHGSNNTERVTNSYSTFAGWVNDCESPGGTNGATNWELALKTADAINFHDDDPTYIIFISDGNPTVRLSYGNQNDGARIRNGNSYFTTAFGGVYGTGNSDSGNWNFKGADDFARELIKRKYLFNVGIFGDATRMGGLANNGFYEGGEDMSLAFDAIIQQISARVGYADVEVTDGITSMTSSTLVHGNPSDFTYKVTDTNGNDITDEVLTDPQRNARYGDPEKDYEAGRVIWDLGDQLLTNGATYSVSFIVWPNQESYDLVADLNNGKRVWTDLTDEEKSQVVGSGANKDQAPYSLKTNTEAGATYCPTKETTNANGEKIYKKGDPQTISLTPPDPMELTDSKVKIEKVWEDSLDTSQFDDLMKENPNYTAYFTLNKENQPYITGIEIKPKKNGDTYERVWPEVDSQGNDKWHNISTGLMVSTEAAEKSGLNVDGYPTADFNGKTYHILETGRDYTFVEGTSDYHFELEDKVFHPMVVDGELMDVTFTTPATIETSGVVESIEPLEKLSATNQLKGGIQFRKKVLDSDGTNISNAINRKFKITVILTTPDGDPYHAHEGIGGYRINYGTMRPASEKDFGEGDAAASNEERNRSQRYPISDGGFSVEIYPDEYVQVANVDRGVIYEVVEKDGDVPSGYQRGEVEYDSADHTMTSNESHQVVVNNIKGTVQNGSLKIRKSIQENGSDTVSVDVKTKLAGTYEFTIYKNAECTEPLLGEDGTPVKVTLTIGANGEPVTSPEVSDLEPGDYWIKETLPANDSLPVTNPVKVTVQAGKTGENAAVAEFVNNYETTKVTVTKQWSDSGHANDTITFALYQVAENSAGQVLREGEYSEQYTKTITNNGSVTIEGLPKKGAINGEEVTYRYYVTETNWKSGYVPASGSRTTDNGEEWTLRNIGHDDQDENTSLTVTKKWKDADNNDVTESGHNEDAITFKLIQRVVASDYVPVAVTLINADGNDYKTEVFYARKGSTLTLRASKPRTYSGTHSVIVSTTAGDAPQTWSSGGDDSHDFNFTVNQSMTITAQVRYRFWGLYDRWGEALDWDIAQGATWTCDVSGADYKTELDDVLAAGGTEQPEQVYNYELHRDSIEGPFSPSASGWTASFDETLPLYKKVDDGTYYIYSYSIDEIAVNGATVTNKETDNDGVITGMTDDYLVTVDQDTNTITNQERPKVDVEADKAWLNADGTTTAPTGGKVTFELYADNQPTGKTVELDGSVDAETAYYESEVWKALWKDLPKYSDYANTQEISYVVKEVSGFAPYVNQNTDGVASGGTITNKENSYGLRIIKQDKDDPTTKLENATFELYRIKNEIPSGNDIEHDGDLIDSRTTDGDGIIDFNNLSEGYYEVKETGSPTGYVRDDDAAFYVKVDKHGIHLISKDIHSAPGEWTSVASYPDGFVYEFSIAGNGEPAAVTVTNEKGAELPSAGGIGTTIFYILGSMLAIGCGVILVSRRRIRRDGENL